MSYFGFLQTAQASQVSEEIKPIESQRTQAVTVDQIQKRIKASENQKRFKQFWDRLPINEVGIMRSTRVNIRIHPHGFKGDKTIAVIQYQIVPSQVMGDFEFSHAREWHSIGHLENRKERIVFFLEPHTESLPIGFLAIIETHLKEYGLVSRDALKEVGCRGVHPFLDLRLMQLLRVGIKPGSDKSKPFTLARDTRTIDPCCNMKPDDSISTFKRSSKRSQRHIKMAEKRIAFLESQNENLKQSLETVKDREVTIDPVTGKIVDSWFKVERDRALNLVSINKRKDAVNTVKARNKR